MNRFLIMLGSVLSLIPGLTTAQDAELHPEKSKQEENQPQLLFFGRFQRHAARLFRFLYAKAL